MILAEPMSLLADTKNDHVLNYTPSFMQPGMRRYPIQPQPQKPELMKPTKPIISFTCLLFAFMCGVAQAQLTNLLGNPGFELPDIGKYTNFDAGGPTPFWNDDGVNYTNTGVENTGAHSGTYRAFEMVGDDGAYQISTNPVVLHTGNQIILTWWAMGTTASDPQGTNPTDPMQIVGIITATNYNDINGNGNDLFTNTHAVLVTSNGLPNAWVQYSLTYTVQAADAGKYPGCFFFTGEVTNTPTANVFAAYDDFALWVVPAGSKPIILTEPVSQTAPPGGNVSFTVSALDATGYRWQAGAPGSGVYTNLLNAGQFSGVNTTTLTITTLTTNNNMDIVVVVSNGSGSVTSAPPANLTVASVLYFENFNLPTSANQPIPEVGWMNDINGSFGGRIFCSTATGVTYPNMAVYSFVSSAVVEAFYGNSTTITGGPYPAPGQPHPITNHMAFPGINLAVAQNVSFNVDLDANYAPGSGHSFICVQMNFGGWFVSTNELPYPPGIAFVTRTYKFNPAASAWDQLTVSGTGSDTANLTPVIGALATNDMTGYITGIGIVIRHTAGSTVQFDNYTVLAAIPPSLAPVISSPPVSVTNYTGTTATFSVSANSNGVTAGLSYQWQTNTAVGSTTWGYVTDGSKFSGVTTPTLSVFNVNAATDHKDFRVIVTDGYTNVISGLPNGPQATLTVLPSAPILVIPATIQPNDANLFRSTSVTNEAGNNNTLNFIASFTGTQPMSYQWQIASDTNGTGLANILGATNATYTLSNPQVSDTWYYRLQASNSISGATPTNSDWVQLTIYSSTNAVIHWSAPVVIGVNGGNTALTKAQFLGLPGTYFEAESFGATTLVTVTNNGTVFSFDNLNTATDSATYSARVNLWPGAYTGASTGDTNLDGVIGNSLEGYTTETLTLNNLTAGLLYTVQLFSVNDNNGPLRQGSYSASTDPADVSASFTYGDNVYVVGTFIATATTQGIIENMGDGHGYMNGLIVRTLAGPPSPTIQKSGSNLQVSYQIGTLLQATSLKGPWVTNSTGGGTITVSPTGVMFYRVQIP